mgnify:FL=1
MSCWSLCMGTNKIHQWGRRSCTHKVSGCTYGRTDRRMYVRRSANLNTHPQFCGGPKKYDRHSNSYCYDDGLQSLTLSCVSLFTDTPDTISAPNMVTIDCWILEIPNDNVESSIDKPTVSITDWNTLALWRVKRCKAWKYNNTLSLCHHDKLGKFKQNFKMPSLYSMKLLKKKIIFKIPL